MHFINFFKKTESTVRKSSPAGSFWYKTHEIRNKCVFIVISSLERFLNDLKSTAKKYKFKKIKQRWVLFGVLDTIAKKSSHLTEPFSHSYIKSEAMAGCRNEFSILKQISGPSWSSHGPPKRVTMIIWARLVLIQFNFHQHKNIKNHVWFQ